VVWNRGGLRLHSCSAVEVLGVTLVLFHLLSAYKPNAPDQEATGAFASYHSLLPATEEKQNAVEKQDVAEDRIAW
jgi:hypothetical protein